MALCAASAPVGQPPFVLISGSHWLRPLPSAALCGEEGIWAPFACEAGVSWRRPGAGDSLRRNIWRISRILERRVFWTAGDSTGVKAVSLCMKAPCRAYSRVLNCGSSVRAWAACSEKGWEGGCRPSAGLSGPSALRAVASLVLIRTRSVSRFGLGRSAGAGVSSGRSVSGKSASGTGSAVRPLLNLIFFSSFSALRSARRLPSQAASSIWSPL